MNYHEWVETYKPIRNHFTSAPFDGTMFETYGEELEFVRQQTGNHIWTMVDSDDGKNMIISNGYHIVNRLGYFITEVPFTGSGFIDVPVYDDDELDDEEFN